MTDTISSDETQAALRKVIAEAISLSFREEGYVEGMSDPSEWEEFLRAADQVVRDLAARGYAIGLRR